MDQNQTNNDGLTIGIIVDSIYYSAKSNFNVEISKEKIRPLAVEIGKLKGIASPDKFKNYQHVADILELYKNHGINVTWEEIEQLTGNLFSTMRRIEKKILDEVDQLYKLHHEGVLKDEDFLRFKNNIKSGQKLAWQEIENQQIKGNSIVLSRIKEK